MRVYVASSWRNSLQPSVVEALRAEGHEVYDFRNPPERTGFGWGQVIEDLPPWSAEKTRDVLSHPISEGTMTALDRIKSTLGLEP